MGPVGTYRSPMREHSWHEKAELSVVWALRSSTLSQLFDHQGQCLASLSQRVGRIANSFEVIIDVGGPRSAL